MPRRSSLATSVLSLVLLTTPARGQSAGPGVPHLAPGARIRVATDSHLGSTSGAIVSYRPDTLVYRADGDGRTVSVPVASISRLELSGGYRTRRTRGTVLGFLGGALVGGGIGLAMYEKAPCLNDPSRSFVCIDVGPMEALLGAAVGGGVGGTIGNVIGGRRREAWNPVSVPLGGSGRVGVVPRARGVSLSASIAL